MPLWLSPAGVLWVQSWGRGGGLPCVLMLSGGPEGPGQWADVGRGTGKPPAAVERRPHGPEDTLLPHKPRTGVA